MDPLAIQKSTLEVTPNATQNELLLHSFKAFCGENPSANPWDDNLLVWFAIPKKTVNKEPPTYYPKICINYTCIFRICKSSASWKSYLVKRHKFYTWKIQVQQLQSINVTCPRIIVVLTSSYGLHMFDSSCFLTDDTAMFFWRLSPRQQARSLHMASATNDDFWNQERSKKNNKQKTWRTLKNPRSNFKNQATTCLVRFKKNMVHYFCDKFAQCITELKAR